MMKSIIKNLHWIGAIPHTPTWMEASWDAKNPVMPWIMTKKQSCQHPGCFKTKPLERWEEDFGKGWIRKYPQPEIRKIHPLTQS